jgi:uncharacterized membrane protein YeaQ/YmgE (transglycosylase-associated protein family)
LEDGDDARLEIRAGRGPEIDPGGFIITILLGIAGSYVATSIGQRFGWYQEGQPAGFIGAILGAILILVLYRLIRRR